MITIKKYIKYIGNIVTVLSIAFVIYALFKLNIDFSRLANVKAVIICIAGSLGVTLTVYILAFAWKNTLDYLAGTKTGYREAAHVYGKANIGKYLPGNVMHYVERNLFATKIGLNQLELAISSVLEVIGIVIVALLFSLICAYKELVMALREYMQPVYIIIAVVAVVLVIAVAIVICLKSKRVREMLGRLTNVKFLIVFIENMLIYAVVFAILGIVLVLICGYILEINLTVSMCAMVITYYMLAWVVGFVIPGAPGGIGVREAVLVLLMGSSSVMSGSQILMAALVHRMLSIIGDIVGYFISLLLAQKE